VVFGVLKDKMVVHLALKVFTVQAQLNLIVQQVATVLKVHPVELHAMMGFIVLLILQRNFNVHLELSLILVMMAVRTWILENSPNELVQEA
jgi:hypothetical protein